MIRLGTGAGPFVRLVSSDSVPPEPAPLPPLPLSTEPAPADSLPKQTPAETPAAPESTEAEKPAEAGEFSKPFIIYQEEKQKPLAESIKSKMKEEPVPIKKFSAPPPKARLEILPGEADKRKRPPEMARSKIHSPPRVVHYSELRTPLDEFGQPRTEVSPAAPAVPPPPQPREEVVDLSQYQKDESGRPPSPGQPKVDRNTLNLR